MRRRGRVPSFAMVAAFLAVTVLGVGSLSAGVAHAQTEPVEDAPSTTVPEESTDDSPTEESPTTTVPDASPESLSLSLPGLGEIVLDVDPATGAILAVVVTPTDGIVVGDPVFEELDGVHLTFTTADGGIIGVSVEVEFDDGVLTLEYRFDGEGREPIDGRLRALEAIAAAMANAPEQAQNGLARAAEAVSQGTEEAREAAERAREQERLEAERAREAAERAREEAERGRGVGRP